MSGQPARHARRLTVLAGAILAIGACSTDRASVTDPFRGDIYAGRLVPDGRNLPGGTVAENEAGDSLVIRISGVEELATGAYHVWLTTIADGAVTASAPATGNVLVITSDTVRNELGDDVSITVDTATVAGNTFTAGGPNRVVEVHVANTAVGASTGVLVTIETGAATAPTTTGPRPLWSTSLDDALSFGTFNAADVEASYRFVPVGRGYISFIDQNSAIVADSALARPPVGYYYAAVLYARGASRIATDTFDLGEHTAPWPRRGTSLRNADEQLVDPVVLGAPYQQILAAGVRYDAASGRPFAGFTEAVVTLEAKQGIAAASPVYVLLAPVPAPIGAPLED